MHLSVSSSCVHHKGIFSFVSVVHFVYFGIGFVGSVWGTSQASRNSDMQEAPERFTVDRCLPIRPLSELRTTNRA